MNRLNAHSELRETFLSSANFFRNSWLTRHSARIMSRLRERSPEICPAFPISSSLLSLSLSPSPSLLPSLPGAASSFLSARLREILLISAAKNALKKHKRSINYLTDHQTNEQSKRTSAWIKAANAHPRSRARPKSSRPR